MRGAPRHDHGRNAEQIDWIPLDQGAVRPSQGRARMNPSAFYDLVVDAMEELGHGGNEFLSDQDAGIQRQGPARNHRAQL
jgi:hypothetical protein